MDLRIINTDGGTQPRDELDKAVIADFAAGYTRGDKFPPIVVFYDGKRYWLADGFHRHHAMLYECDLKKASCEVIAGTVDDAKWYACAANQSHGLRRSTEDKRCAVEMALRNPHAVGLSDLQLAKHVGVDDKTVAKRRREMVGRSEIPNVSTRTDSAGRQQPATKPKKAAGEQDGAPAPPPPPVVPPPPQSGPPPPASAPAPPATPPAKDPFIEALKKLVQTFEKKHAKNLLFAKMENFLKTEFWK
jgi:hypothetical protein